MLEGLGLGLRYRLCVYNRHNVGLGGVYTHRRKLRFLRIVYLIVRVIVLSATAVCA